MKFLCIHIFQVTEMDKKLDIILDILQPNTHHHNPKDDDDDNNDGRRRKGMSDPRRFSTGTGSTGIPGMMMSAGNSQSSSRMTSRTHSMDLENGQEAMENEEAESDSGHSKRQKRGIDLAAGASTGNHGLESSELTKRLERLKDEEDVLRRRINSTTSNGGEPNSKLRARTQSSRFTVTPSLYTPDDGLSRETLDEVITESKNGKSQNERLAGTSSLNKNADNSRQQQQRHHQKPFSGNLKKYQSAPSLPPPPKHKSLKDNNHSNTGDTTSSSPTSNGGAKDGDCRRSSSVHFDESSLVKHRSQSEIFPVYRDPGFITSASSQPSLVPHGRSSSMTTPSPQHQQQRQTPDNTKTASTTTSNLSVNDIRGNAYVSDIDSSDEANSSKNSTPAREHSTATTPRLSSRESMVANTSNSIDSVNSSQQQQQGNDEILKPISVTPSNEAIPTTTKDDSLTLSTQPPESSPGGHENLFEKSLQEQPDLISETTFSSPPTTPFTPDSNQTDDTTSRNSSNNDNSSKSSALLPPPPVQTARRKSEPLNSTGPASEVTTSTAGTANSNGHLSKSAFNLNC